MAQEIERKFLVNMDKVDLPEQGLTICQGYIQTTDKTTVRIRIMGDKAFLTLKGETKGISRSEFEYEVPVTDARQMLDELCKGPVVDKTRYLISHKNHLWELDIFAGDNEGLIVAEVELDSEDEQPELPDWVTEEVTGDRRYYNSNLLTHPFKNW
ncbi:CYTH domain-containing protein [Amphritea pacifica]|uniref:CYTH domain-containing protein n=1 Tax=Amphritea pacifica TaxID=2811233 RepID=UPI001962B720|nr:CYTH domain-containing protein [Amphritea pacifica]MBN1008368.1 CYTH domain-containing protein [Amphritea pacifica]